MLLLSAFNGAKQETNLTNYTMPDGTRVEYGTFKIFTANPVKAPYLPLLPINDLEQDQYISGNLLVSTQHTVETINDNGEKTILVGNYANTGYTNGYGTMALVFQPKICQISPELVLLTQQNHRCIRLLNRTDNNYVSNFVGKCGRRGYLDGIGTAAKFDTPVDLIQHPGNPNLIFVAEKIGNIRLIYIDAKLVTTYLHNALPGINSIQWDPYYCNVMLIVDNDSFKRLQIDTFTLTTYNNASGYINGSLYVGPYKSLTNVQTIYKDLYAVVEYTAQRLRIIDTARCVVSSICSDVSRPEALNQCLIDSPTSLLYTSGMLYICERSKMSTLLINVALSGSSAYPASCAPPTLESTKNKLTLIDAPLCPPPRQTTTPSTTPTTTATTTPTTTPITTLTTTPSTQLASSSTPHPITSPDAIPTRSSTTIPATSPNIISTSTLTTVPSSTPTTIPATTPTAPSILATLTTNYSYGVSATNGYKCAVGTPNDYVSKICTDGCFGLYRNGESVIGCMTDLNLTDYGFGDITTCGTTEQNGKCIKVTEELEEGESCIRCCTNGEHCNTLYKDGPDYIAIDTGYSSYALRVNKASALLISATLLLKNL